MFKFIKKVEEERVKLDNFIKEQKAFNKQIHDECVKQLCENANICGMANIQIDWEKDVYLRYSNIEVLMMRNEWQLGRSQARIDELERVSTN